MAETGTGSADGTELEQRVRAVEALILDRTPEHDIDPTLDRIRELLDLLGSPQAAAPVVRTSQN